MLPISTCHAHALSDEVFSFWFAVCSNGRATWRVRSAVGCVPVCFVVVVVVVVVVVGLARSGCIVAGWWWPVCQRGLGLFDSMFVKPSLQALRAETMVERFTARMHVAF